MSNIANVINNRDMSLDKLTWYIVAVTYVTHISNTKPELFDSRGSLRTNIRNFMSKLNEVALVNFEELETNIYELVMIRRSVLRDELGFDSLSSFDSTIGLTKNNGSSLRDTVAPFFTPENKLYIVTLFSAVSVYIAESGSNDE